MLNTNNSCGRLRCLTRCTRDKHFQRFLKCVAFPFQMLDLVSKIPNLIYDLFEAPHHGIEFR